MMADCVWYYSEICSCTESLCLMFSLPLLASPIDGARRKKKMQGSRRRKISQWKSARPWQQDVEQVSTAGGEAIGLIAMIHQCVYTMQHSLPLASRSANIHTWNNVNKRWLTSIVGLILYPGHIKKGHRNSHTILYPKIWTDSSWVHWGWSCAMALWLRYGAMVTLPVGVGADLRDGRLAAGEEDLGIGDVEEEVLHVYWSRWRLPCLKYPASFRQSYLLRTKGKKQLLTNNLLYTWKITT